MVNTLKWKLWLALAREELRPEQINAREAQHQWMRAYINGLPEHTPAYTHAKALAKLEQLFDDPLDPLFYEPLSENQFDTFQKAIQGDQAIKSDAGLSFIVPSFVRDTLFTRYPRLEGIPLPFDEKIASGGQGGTQVYLTFPSNDLFRGNTLSLGDIETGRRILDVRTGSRVRIPESVKMGEASLKKWLGEQGKGDLGYDDANGGGLFAVRGAKMAVLDVSDWIEADRVSDAKLHTLIKQQGKTVLPLKAYAQAYRDNPDLYGRGQLFVAVETREGRLAVVRVVSYGEKDVMVHTRVRPVPSLLDLPASQPTSTQAGTQPVAKTPLAASIRLISAELDKGIFRWQISRETPMCISHGWYSLTDEGIKEHVGGGTHAVAEAGNLDLGLGTSLKEGMLHLDMPV
jgi:hypothetical protein